VDQDGKQLDIVMISAPFREEKHEKMYLSFKEEGKEFCGISSYLDFPNKIDNPYEDRFHEQRKHDYPAMVKAWLHCFRNPEYTRPFSHLPHMLMTEADLIDVGEDPKPVEKIYDFMYVCLKDNDQCTAGWQSYNRNWNLAQICLEIMCGVFQLRGVMVGRVNCDYTDKCNGIVKTYDFLPYNEFQEEMKKSKFLFVPNISDASPRVITEAMKHNIPVLCNYDILGGWHNIIPDVTGEFFRDHVTLAQVMPEFLKKIDEGKYNPRKWFKENRGKYNSGKKLCEFLRQHFPQKVPKETESIFIY
jgi:hypothetical protein